MLDDEEEQADCDEVASGADAAACTASISDVCASAPPTNPPASGGTDACSKLETCCGNLDDEDAQEACAEYASTAEAAECSAAVAQLCPDDEGGDDEPADPDDDEPADPDDDEPADPDDEPADPDDDESCTELESCCGDLDDEDEQAECEEVATDGDADACSEAAGDFCS